MILRTLTVKNFRQFLGEQRIDFAPPGKHNVTVLYGANGSGKTTVLNAFTWALFDKLTPAFENSQLLLSERVWHDLPLGSSAELFVRLSFEHDGVIYDVTRSQTIEKDSQGRRRDNAPRRHVLIQSNGKTEAKEDGTDLIRQILPPQLHQFFFFDGERIEKLLLAGTSERPLDAAIKTILGLEVLEQALVHLPMAKTLLRKQLRKGGGSLEELSARTEDLEQKVNRLNSQLKGETENREGYELQRVELDRLLRDHEVAKEKQRRIDLLKENESHFLEEIARTRTRLRRSLSNGAYTAFAKTLATRAGAKTEELRSKGRLPAPYRDQFIRDLLVAARCICGSVLDEGGRARECVTALLADAGREELETAWSRISADSGNYLVRRQEIQDELIEAVKIGLSLEASLKETRGKIDDIGAALLESEVREVADYAAKRVGVQHEIDESGLTIARLKVQLDEESHRFEESEAELKKAKTNDGKAKAVQRQYDAADRLESAIREILDLRRERVREQLDERIKETYATIAYKPYIPELTEKFQLVLTKKLGSGEELTVAKSQGENQILALSFVGALASIARERFEERGRARDSISTFEGGLYPIVMDSPFGALDDNYRQEVARAIPQLAPQVVALMSKSQGLGVVYSEMGERIGKAYVIEYHTPKREAGAEIIQVGESPAVPYISFAADGFEAAELREVR